MNNSPETSAIRKLMEEVRRDLDESVQEIVEGTRDMGEWRSYVRAYPRICLGAAVVVGYTIISSRRSDGRPDSTTLAELAKQSRLLATSSLTPNVNARGLLSAFVGNVLMRGVSSFIGQQAGKLFATQPVKSQGEQQP